MRRWLWLLALPWIVSVDTYTEKGYVWSDYTLNYEIKGVNFEHDTIPCPIDSINPCEDLAEALNEAHERVQKRQPCRGMTLDECADLCAAETDLKLMKGKP